MKLLTLGLVLALATPALAEDMTIDMLNKRDDGAQMVYSEDIARIDVGDTITWVPTDKGHNVEFLAGPMNWEAPKKSKLSKEYSYTFDEPGIYLYQCTPHKSMGMIALVMVGEKAMVGAHNMHMIHDANVKGMKSKKKLAKLLEDL